MIRVGLLGASGRMGKWVSQLLASEFSARAQLSAQPTRTELGTGVYGPLLEADVVIDFSMPEVMHAIADSALKHAGPLPAFIIGSTGWTSEKRRKLEELSQRTPVLMASNFSTGVLVLADLLKQASPLLSKLGYTPVIVEAHHQHKKDAPSGTALSLQRAIFPTHGEGVQTHSIRAGEVIGDHEVTFYGAGDHITLGHFAQDRSIFARGAIDVALWLSTKRGSSPQGLIGIETYFEEIKCSS